MGHHVMRVSPMRISPKIQLSNQSKWVFNQMSLAPWCHAMDHFEAKMGRFSA